MGFRQVTVPYQRYRHSSARLLTRENPLTEISLIMIVDVSGLGTISCHQEVLQLWTAAFSASC